MSEFSGPVTPSSDQSTNNDEGFVDVLTYDLVQSFQDTTMHGLPLSPSSKVIGPDQRMYDSWEIIPHSAGFDDTQSTQFLPQLVLSTAGNFPHPDMIEQAGLDVEMVPPMDPSWNHFSSVANPDMTHHWGIRGLDHVVPGDGLQDFCIPQTQQLQEDMHMIVPSATMVDVASACILDGAEAVTDSGSYGLHATTSLIQLPQEVSYKRESSPLLKTESDREDIPSRSMRRSIYVSSTGGKSVIKKRRSCVTKNRSGIGKRNRGFTGISDGGEEDDEDKKVTAVLDGQGLLGTGIEVVRNGVELFLDEETGKRRYVSTLVHSPAKRCYCIDPRTGTLCTRQFARPEHLKRHVKTHDGKREFSCNMCPKQFNRHDNLQAHMLTHLRLPGRKGRNPKMSLAQIEKEHCSDPVTGPKLMAKMRQKWKKEVGDECMANELV
jgi:hypothetical protein